MRLRRTARDSELIHSQLEGGSFHSKMLCCAIRTSHNPIAFLESLKNLLAFGFFQERHEVRHLSDFGAAVCSSGRLALENFRSATSTLSAGPVEIITARSITF